MIYITKLLALTYVQLFLIIQTIIISHKTHSFNTALLLFDLSTLSHLIHSQAKKLFYTFADKRKSGKSGRAATQKHKSKRRPYSGRGRSEYDINSRRHSEFGKSCVKTKFAQNFCE